MNFRLLVLLLLTMFTIQTGFSRDRQKVRVDELDPPREVQGLMSHRAWYTEDGTLYRLDLAEADTLLGWVIPSGSMVHFLEDGVTPKFVFLSSDTQLDSILVHGSGHNWMTTFHPNGKLKTVWLAEEADVAGIPLRKATFWRAVRQRAETRFHDNGQLALGWLRQDVTIQGKKLKKGDMVRFDREGKLFP